MRLFNDKLKKTLHGVLTVQPWWLRGRFALGRLAVDVNVVESGRLHVSLLLFIRLDVSTLIITYRKVSVAEVVLHLEPVRNRCDVR